jgi:hypothetical protein
MIATAFLGYLHSPKWFKCINNNSNDFNNTPYPTGKINNSTSNNKTSKVVQDFLLEKNLKPVFVYENLKDQIIKDKIKSDTKYLSGVYLILNKITLDYYIGSASTDKLYTRFSRHLINFTGSKIGYYKIW